MNIFIFKKMLKANCSYENNTFSIQYNKDSNLSQVLFKCANKIGKDLNKLNYIINFKNSESDENEENNISEENFENNEQMIKAFKPQQIICPNCHLIPILKFENYKISLTGCKCPNKDIFDNILLYEFDERQKMPCLDNNHNEIEMKIQSQIKCGEHDELFCAYCNNCKKDLCLTCKSIHKSDFPNHNIIRLGDLIIDKDELSKLKLDYEILKEKINETNKMIEEYVSKLEKVKQSLDVLKNIANDFIENYDPKKRNFAILYNINNFKYDFVVNDLKNINNDKDINSKFQKIIELYDKMIYMNEINITYCLNEENIKNKKVKIFGKIFVENNKDKCKILYKDKIHDLTEYIEIINDNNNLNQNQNENKIISIKLIDINKITNLSNMFNDCTQLLYFSNISKINTINITDISNMFYGCNQIVSLPDISNWNTSNISNMAGLFQGCSSLLSLPDISKWNTSNVKNMSSLFEGCANLVTIKIADWDISKVESMNSLFKECKSLQNLPGISNWDTSHVKDKLYMYNKTDSLKI